MLVMVNNLAGEPRNDVTLRLSEKWHGAAVARLAWAALGSRSARRMAICGAPPFLSGT